MAKFIKLEKFIFYLFTFLFFLQGRLILHAFRLQPNEWTSAYLYLTDILILAVIFLWFFRWFTQKPRSKVKFSVNEIALGVFLLVSVLSVSISNNLKLSLYGFGKLIEFGLLFLYLKHNFLKIFNPERFWQVFIGSALLQGIVALAQFFKQSSLGLKNLESPLSPALAGVAKIDVGAQKIVRAYGLVPHPNILAAILVAAIFGLAYLFIKNYAKIKIWQKIIYAAVFVIISSALFFTFSRSVTVFGIAFLLLWLALVFWQKKQYRRPIIIFVISLAIISLLLIAVFWRYITARYDLGDFGQSLALNLRLFYNQVALDLIKNSPVFGIGQNNFVWTLTNLDLLPTWAYQPVHNIYLLIGAETGLIGLLAFLTFLFLTLKSSWRFRSDFVVTCQVSLIFCLLVFGLSDHFLWDLQQGQILFWLFLGILANLISGPYGSTDRAQPSGG